MRRSATKAPLASYTLTWSDAALSKQAAASRVCALVWVTSPEINGDGSVQHAVCKQHIGWSQMLGAILSMMQHLQGTMIKHVWQGIGHYSLQLMRLKCC